MGNASIGIKVRWYRNIQLNSKRMTFSTNLEKQSHFNFIINTSYSIDMTFKIYIIQTRSSVDKVSTYLYNIIIIDIYPTVGLSNCMLSAYP